LYDAFARTLASYNWLYTRGNLSKKIPGDVAFDLRFRAAVQDQVGRTAVSRNQQQFASNLARQLRVQADLIDQGVPVERVIKAP
jgi:hypothetical protein